ncbi:MULTISPECIES: Pepco domain-containing protein [unclassified Microcoleus]|uniref:Pepco domain-containing protein n=1 Tax=unclassified Microcoleus TaxID=2642155 RepID=UPI002FD75468
MPDETIWIVTADTSDESPDAPDDEGAKNGGHIGLDWSDAWDAQPNQTTPKQAAKAVDSLRLHNVSIKKLEKELVDFMQTVDQMFSRADAEADMKAIELSEIELSVAINAEGSFSLVGLGAKVADTRTVLLRFKRKS